MSSVLSSCPPSWPRSTRTAFSCIRAAYSPAASPAGPPPTMIRSKVSLTISTTCTGDTQIPHRSPMPELDAEASPGRGAHDVVVGTADRAGAAFHAVAEADDRLLL